MGIGGEEHRRRDDTHGAPRTEAERRRAEESLGRMDSAESVGPFVAGAEDRTGYERTSARRNVCGGRTRGAPHRDPVQPGPNPSVLVRRFLFHSHVRRPGQSVAQFAAELKHLSDQCGFGSALDDALRDRLVCGLEEEAVQRRLLEEDSPLSFDRALDISLAMEAAGHVRDLQNGTGTGRRAVAVLHVVRDVDHLLVVKDKVPHEQNWNPGLDQKDLELPPIKEEKEAPLTSMEGGRLRCLMQHIPVLDSLEDLERLWAVKHHVPPEQKDSRPSLDQAQGDPDPPGTEEEPETLYAIKEGEQHQSPILVLECPEDMQQLLVVKEELPPEQDPRPSLDQDQVHPDPALIEEQEPWTGRGLKEVDVDCEGLDPDTNPEIMDSRKRAAPDSDCGSEPKRTSISTDGPVDRHADSHTAGQFGSFGQDTTSTCPILGLRPRKNGVCVQRVDGLSLRCSTCGKGFLYKSWLKKHMRVHTAEEGPAGCGTSFSHTHHLTTHTQVHTLETPVHCSAGEKRLSPQIYLEKYVINRMGERNFVCSVCDKIFVSRKKLNNHRRVHPAETPYDCPEPFYVQSPVKRLIMLHTERKPYRCSECGNSFPKMYSLRRHMMIHTGEKPYGCSVCEKRFRQAVHLTLHMTRSHGFSKEGSGVTSSTLPAEFIQH